MKKQVLTGLLCLAMSVQASAQFVLSGKIVDSANEPVAGANVIFPAENKGTVTGETGMFRFVDVPKGTYEITISFVGYESVSKTITVERNRDIGVVTINEKSFLGEEVTVTALRAGEKTPMAFVNIDREEIEAQNYGKDIPYLLKMTPSLITSSDAGNGIGYTSMRIRGSDANRINVTVNGIPLNDAESQGVFWVDLPDLASSTEQIQVQRGVGTSTNGAGAFGATINLLTEELNKQPYARYDGTVGSFNTFKNTIAAGTGLLNGKYAVDLRLSDVTSDGFIDRAYTDLQSYYLSAGMYGEKSSLKFITFGGFEEVYQAWGGIPSSILETNRTYNEMGAYTDSTGQTSYYENQVDHYDQVHYQLHYFRELTSRLHLNAALHYTWGKGYYEQYETGQDYAYYGMVPVVIGNDTATATDLVRRKWLDNDFYGAIASLTWGNDDLTLISGGGVNRYDGLHFGRVIWARYLGENDYGHQWYEGTGVKTDWNIYGKSYYGLNDQLTIFADMQVRGVSHDISGTDANNRDVTQQHAYLFFNPKAGLNYTPAPGHRAFVSYARANREPNRNNYTDAPPGQTPTAETLNDYEAGYSFDRPNLHTGVTIYFMDYTDQLVLTGQINEVGYPVMTNVEESYRAGVEIEASLNISDKVLLGGNLALSRNRINDFVNYIDNWDYWSDPGNEPYQYGMEIGNSTLAYSPSVVTAARIQYNVLENVYFEWLSKYVGRQFIDNTGTMQYSIDPYFVNDLRASWTLATSAGSEFIFSLLVANILDEKYETNAWLYRYVEGGTETYMDGYYPQAGRHIMFSLGMKF